MHTSAARAALVIAGIVTMLAAGASTTSERASSTPAVDSGQQCKPDARSLVPETTYLVERLGLEQAWELSEGKGVTVAVVDSGVDANNVHFKGALVPGVSTFGPPTASPTTDVFGHGTAIAGLIAAREVEGSGVIGIAPEAQIMPVRAFESGPEDGQSSGQLVGPSMASVTAGIRAAVDGGAQIINVSLSDDQSEAQYAAAVSYARERGSLVIASAGNRKTAPPNSPDPTNFYPGELDGAISVAGVLQDGTWSAESSYEGSQVDIAAPGQSVPSTYISGGDCVFNADSASSSYATAIVSGAAALVAARFPKETPDQWAFRLTQSAMRVSPAERTDTVGWGEVRPAAALALIDDGTLPGPPSPVFDAPDPEESAPQVIAIESGSDPLDPARAIIGWGFGVAATISAIALLLAHARSRTQHTSG